MNGRKGSDVVKVDRGHHEKCYNGCGCEVDDNTSMTNHGNSDSDNDSNYKSVGEYDGDSSLSYADDEDCDTDDDCDARSEETQSFLYRHFTISIVANGTPGKPNLVFMKATLLHTKGEDNNPRM